MIQKLILGSYTRKESKGIYSIELDAEKKELNHLVTMIEEGNPTYLAKSKKETIYTVSQDGTFGGVAAYKKEADNTYSFVNRITEEGAPPCYVAIDETRQLVYGANYHKGLVVSYRINEDDSITLADRIEHIGNGPHENQTVPHAHFADLTPDERLVACDLGNDTVYTYDVSSEGKLTEVANFKAKPGTGPRHIVFHPNEKTAYLFGELSSEVVVLSYQKETGEFSQQQIISTLPEDFNDFNGGAAIRISKDGKFLYVSNRGHNSLAVYQISEDSLNIDLIQHISVEGDFPRDFDLTPDQKFIVVANQNSNNLTLFERDTTNGKLALIQKDVYAPEIVCVTFA
ncbi:lactonase family protein [Vagococcus carniphilus]|uniref:lactonase family protein n=1 Tax=Vagococcus carniphilus TaxID=218144 RepID=UPI003B594C90